MIITAGCVAVEGRLRGDIQASAETVKSALRGEIQASETRMMGMMNVFATNVDERIDAMNVKMDKLLTVIVMDGLANNYTALRQEETFGAHTQSQHRDRLDDHEKRILKLEVAASEGCGVERYLVALVWLAATP